MWKVERTAELALVRFGIHMGYGIGFDEHTSATDTRWSPIKSISIYANSYKEENLITELSPRQRSYGNSLDVVYFHPTEQEVCDSDWFKFNIDLLGMRPNILRSLD